jgi:hypothetical protein
MKLNIKGIKLTKSQEELYKYATDNTTKYIIANWSRQSGKSTIVSLLCIKWLTMKDEEVIYVTPTYSLAKKIYSNIIKLLPQELISKSNSSDLIIESVTGSRLLFFSSESGQAMRGNTATKLVIDEAAYCKEIIDGQSLYHNIIFPITKVKCNKILLISTPRGKEGFYYELVQRAIANEKGFKYLKKTIYDDSLITKEEIDELKRTYPPIAFKCEFEGEFISNALSIFDDYDDLFNNNVSEIYSGYCGIDLSTVGTDNTILTFINNKNEVVQYNIKGDLDTRYNKMASIVNKYSPKAIYIEQNSIGEPIYNELKKLIKKKEILNKWSTTNESKKDIINNLQVLISNKNISFNKNNTLLKSELGTFTYKLTKNGNITFAAIDGFHDDTIMSLAMALQAKEDFKFTNNVTFAKASQIRKMI